jgi:hypothetical protein
MNRKEFIAVFVITCFVLLVWLISEIVHTRPSNPIDPKIQQLLDPITPNFDQKTLQQVSQVRHLEPSVENESPLNSTPSATTAPIPLPTATSLPIEPDVNISTNSAQE